MVLLQHHVWQGFFSGKRCPRKHKRRRSQQSKRRSLAPHVCKLHKNSTGINSTGKAVHNEVRIKNHKTQKQNLYLLFLFAHFLNVIPWVGSCRTTELVPPDGVCYPGDPSCKFIKPMLRVHEVMGSNPGRDFWFTCAFYLQDLGIIKRSTHLVR